MSPGSSGVAKVKSEGLPPLLPLKLIKRNGLRWLNLVKYGVGIILIYILLRLRTFKISEHTHLQSLSDPAIVWEFLADFNNMKTLNPTIIDFEIISDGGPQNDWSYTVRYSEFLHNAPSIQNTITADFHVKKEENDLYTIASTHTTCFFHSVYCVRAWGHFEISKSRKTTAGVDILEEVTFECPPIFFWFCHQEASFQRQQIKENLINYYDKLSTRQLMQGS
ncbi:unnamed protein product [Bemisia tabaci]|uniref:Uncharacterized protein n=1 Tax=Bemisia tabaci TaxID=7038 RepID=A0A9P0AQD5_BEMTA|nr:unnamed protein product [Bemisia tabaci]